MRKLLLICIAVSMSFASYEAYEKARFTFPHKILNVERHYFEDRWIHEVTCSNYVYLIIDDTVDTNYVENIYNGDVLACGDSIVAVTKRYEATDTFCSFHKIYPDDRYVDEWLGKDFDYCLWSDTTEQIIYLVTPTSNWGYGTDYFLHVIYTDLIVASDLTRCSYLRGGRIYAFERYRRGVTIGSYWSCGIEPSGTMVGFVIRGDYYEYNSGQFVGCSRNYRYKIGKTGDLDTVYYYSHPDVGYWETEYTFETRYRKSYLDIDNDGLFDLTARRHDVWEGRSNGEVSGIYIYASDTIAVYPYFENNYVLGRFIDSTTNCMILDGIIRTGPEFADTSTLIGLLPFKTVSDFDNDGIQDFLGIEGTSLVVYGLRHAFELSQGWNLLSPPYVLADSLLSTIFPSSLPGYFQYSPETHTYTETNYFQQGEGVFVYNLEAGILDLSGDPIETVSLDIREGWNMLGGPPHTVQASAILEDSMIVPPLYILNPATSTYEEAEVIYPGQGFWLLSTEDHVLEVE